MTDHAQLFPAGSPEYRAATTPHNSSAVQNPALVARPTSADQASAVVKEAARRGLRVVPQATGHGAGGTLDGSTLLVDTSGLDSLTIDAEARTASAGAGLTWGHINTEAEKHGLLGLAGSSPSVAISGFTFGGGLGWLTRPHGMASSALRSVEYVDGWGTIRTASEDAADALDREALWAFRGGGGVGIATRLDFDLFPVASVWAGYFLWPIDALDSVVSAWAGALGQVGPAVATSISVLHTPPAPPFPPELRGHPVVHLAVASSDSGSRSGSGTGSESRSGSGSGSGSVSVSGSESNESNESNGSTGSSESTGSSASSASPEDSARALIDAVRAAATPTVDTWGEAGVAELAGIHLDPPAAVPALGDARWLGDSTPEVAARILHVAAPAESPLALVEIRTLGNDAEPRAGAETTVPGPFAVHAVGALFTPEGRPAIEQAFAAVREAAATVDLGRSLGSWAEGSTSVPDALPSDVRARVARIADTVDPLGVIARSRLLG